MTPSRVVTQRHNTAQGDASCRIEHLAVLPAPVWHQYPAGPGGEDTSLSRYITGYVERWRDQWRCDERDILPTLILLIVSPHSAAS